MFRLLNNTCSQVGLSSLSLSGTQMDCHRAALMGVGDRNSAKLLGDRLTLSWMDPLPATHTVQPQTSLTNALGPNNGFYFIFIFGELKGSPRDQNARFPKTSRRTRAATRVCLAVPARSLAHRGAGPPCTGSRATSCASFTPGASWISPSSRCQSTRGGCAPRPAQGGAFLGA